MWIGEEWPVRLRFKPRMSMNYLAAQSGECSRYMEEGETRHVVGLRNLATLTSPPNVERLEGWSAVLIKLDQVRERIGGKLKD